MSSEPSSAPIRRTRTPPALKWLLNERAALAGKAQTLQAELANLQQHLALTLSRLDALDASISMMEPLVVSDAAGVVKARERHKKRGSLKAFVYKTLQQAGSAGLDTVSIALAAAAEFGISFPTKQHQTYYRRHIILPLLGRGRKDGVLESLGTARGGRIPQVWRWLGEKPTPSLASVQELVAKRP